MMKRNQWAWSVLGMAIVCGHMLYIINGMIGFGESSLLTVIVMYYRHYAQSRMSISRLSVLSVKSRWSLCRHGTCWVKTLRSWYI